jgi:predicted NUDIX family NTP pyrophosphohydrolase
MIKRSAGVLLFRHGRDGLEVLLAHPGGPFWSRRDEGAWSIPKGEYDERTEDAKTAARRELQEETGLAVTGELMELGWFRQPSGKLVCAFAAEGDFDPKDLKSNQCSVEWPPKSGRFLEVPEVDRVQWFSVAEAARKITKGQAPILDALTKELRADGNGDGRGESA